MYPLIRCTTCNNSIGEYHEIFQSVKNDIYRTELEKLNITDPAALEISNIISIELNDLFDELKIERYCCRSCLTTNVNFDDLLYQFLNNN